MRTLDDVDWKSEQECCIVSQMLGFFKNPLLKLSGSHHFFKYYKRFIHLLLKFDIFYFFQNLESHESMEESDDRKIYILMTVLLCVCGGGGGGGLEF